MTKKKKTEKTKEEKNYIWECFFFNGKEKHTT